MVLERPLLKVSRPVAACSRCRSAKIKCDGKLPACSACEKNGKQVECASANDHFARGKERSYVSTLETRVENLERRIKEAQARKSSVISLPDQEHPHKSSFSSRTNDPTSTLASAKAARRKEARDVDELVSDFGYLAVSAAARDFYGFTTAMSYARLILSACSKDRLPDMVVPLPPRHLVTVVIQNYVDNVFSLLPFFDETSLYYSVDAVYKAESDTASPASDFDHWCIRMILAMSNAALSQQRGDQHYMEGIGHASVALRYAETVLRPGAISSVQALLFLAEYAMSDPHHFDSWSLIGAASRAMVDLGLHQDPPKGTPISKAKLELRRRVYWCVYMLDRSTSIVQTRAFSFSDDSANVSMPPTNGVPGSQKSQERQWLKGFDHAVDLIKVRKLQSIWYMDLFQSGREAWADPYPYLWKTCQAMADWFANLSRNTTPHMRAFFELELMYSYVYLLAPSPRVPVSTPYLQFLIFEHCTAYAHLMTRIINDHDHVAPVTFYDAMRVYMTGRQFLDVLATNQDRLLSGSAPEPPRSSTDIPPPPLRSRPVDAQSNTARSITCIKQLTECLGYFGLRWGYMSWRDSFDRVAEPMMTALNQRLWELQEVPSSLAGPKRPSAWHHPSSNTSLPSSDTLSRNSSYQLSQASPYSPMSGQMPTSGHQGLYAQHSFPSSETIFFAGQPNGLQPQQSPPIDYPAQGQALRRSPSERPRQQFANWHGMGSYGSDYTQAQPHTQLETGGEESVPPS